VTVAVTVCTAGRRVISSGGAVTTAVVVTVEMIEVVSGDPERVTAVGNATEFDAVRR
jgi:hypothetical protein